jgi:hypothetical protein
MSRFLCECPTLGIKCYHRVADQTHIKLRAARALRGRHTLTHAGNSSGVSNEAKSEKAPSKQPFLATQPETASVKACQKLSRRPTTRCSTVHETDATRSPEKQSSRAMQMSQDTMIIFPKCGSTCSPSMGSIEASSENSRKKSHKASTVLAASDDDQEGGKKFKNEYQNQKQKESQPEPLQKQASDPKRSARLEQRLRASALKQTSAPQVIPKQTNFQSPSSGCLLLLLYYYYYFYH